MFNCSTWNTIFKSMLQINGLKTTKKQFDLAAKFNRHFSEFVICTPNGEFYRRIPNDWLEHVYKALEYHKLKFIVSLNID